MIWFNIRINFRKASFVVILVSSFLSCKTGINRNNQTKGEIVQILDSIDASKAIVVDDYTDFFKAINILDMSIQTKTDLSGKNHVEAINYYKNYLQKDVESFTKDESVALKKLFKKLKIDCDKVSEDIFPKNLSLIKTKGKHYGKGIFYTRNESIVIPFEALNNIDSPGFKSTMLHELFHIYSRLHPEKQKELYALIGFKKVSNIDELAMVSSLKDKMLLNPDGVNYAVKIQLENESKFVDAFPIIFSKLPSYNPTISNFFQYLSFDLFEVKSNSGRYEVVSDGKGNSTLDPVFMNSFFKQINDNTQYTIHPDEIMADNFMLMMGLKDSKEKKITFSKSGEILIKEVERVIAK